MFGVFSNGPKFILLERKGFFIACNYVGILYLFTKFARARTHIHIIHNGRPYNKKKMHI